MEIGLKQLPDHHLGWLLAKRRRLQIFDQHAPKTHVAWLPIHGNRPVNQIRQFLRKPEIWLHHAVARHVNRGDGRIKQARRLGLAAYRKNLTPSGAPLLWREKALCKVAIPPFLGYCAQREPGTGGASQLGNQLVNEVRSSLCGGIGRRLGPVLIGAVVDRLAVCLKGAIKSLHIETRHAGCSQSIPDACVATKHFGRQGVDSGKFVGVKQLLAGQHRCHQRNAARSKPLVHLSDTCHRGVNGRPIGFVRGAPCGEQIVVFADDCQNIGLRDGYLRQGHTKSESERQAKQASPRDCGRSNRSFHRLHEYFNKLAVPLNTRMSSSGRRPWRGL